MQDEEPYVGPRAFRRDDQHLFFAREFEANELLSLITAHRIVLFYARSGAGKSSLLNARLVPLLEEDGFVVLPVARVRPMGKELNEIDAQTTQTNVYIYSVLTCLHREASPESLLSRGLGDGLPSSPADEEDLAPRVLIIDQFEELFTTGIWQDRRPFLKQLAAILVRDPTLRVVLAMREDYIAELDPYSDLLPERLTTRFRLEPLRREAAIVAVTQPLTVFGRSFAPGVAEMLVDNLLALQGTIGAPPHQGEFVEPVQLQIVCQSLWRSARELDPPVVSHAHLTRFGDVDQVLRRFYETSVERVVRISGVREGRLRRWLGEHLITPGGTRASVWDTLGLPEQALIELQADRVIDSDIRRGTRSYELAHERLIEAIRLSNEEWRSRRLAEDETCQFLEDRSATWLEAGRPSSLLLTGNELQQAESWLASPEAEDLGVQSAVRALIDTSRTFTEGQTYVRRKPKAAADAPFQLRSLLGMGGLLGLFVLLYFLAGRDQEGLAHIRQGNVEEGFTNLRQELERAGRGSDSQRMSKALLDLSEAYLQLGDGPTALDHLAAVQELPGEESPESRARRLWLHGRALELTGRTREAEDSFLLGLREPTPFVRGRLLCGLGRTLAARDLEAARRTLLRALRTARDRATRLEALATLGGLESSESRLDQALALARDAGDPWMEIDVLVWKARLPGVPSDRAAACMEEAIQIVERLRSKVHARDLSLLLSARFETDYDILTDLLLDLHEARPHAGYAARAFSVSEASQAAVLARELRDRRPLTPMLVERQDELLARLGASGLTREPKAADRVERDLLLGEYWKNRAGQSIASEADRLYRTDSEEVRQLLDPGTVLLEYTLGEERSWLFVISRNTLRVFRLPAEPEIARTVSSLQIGHRDPAATKDAAAELGRMLLGPAAPELRGRRIVVVADGVLGQVPFALLPEPTAGESPLLIEHEVVHIPSASVLAGKQRNLERRTPPLDRLAILADPVISLSDPRLPPGTRTLPMADPGKVLGFRRFIGSRREAEEIRALYHAKESRMATGFAANRSLLTSGSLNQYSILHLAVPAIVDTRRADESSLVLSTFDEHGRPLNGLMSGYEIFGLRLPCDLAILSSGRTALGKLVPGEGYAGLSQAFLAAGAARVIDTIWDVEDRSAAELMIRLHRHLASGFPPSSALRQAQIEMRTMPDRRLSSDWAAFRLEGDWR